MKAGHGSHIPSLDGIRAVAAMFVFVAHAGWGHIVPGGFGVTIFFFLSGYLITTLLRREWEKNGQISLHNFYLRRIYRLFPPLYTVLLLFFFLAMLGVLKHEMHFSAVLSQVLYWTNYYLIAQGGEHFVPGTGITWSLAVEEHFYFVFPLLFLFSVRISGYKGSARLFLTLCVLVLIWRLVLVHLLDAPTNYTYMATDARFDSLLWGCIMGVWRNPVMDGDIALGIRVRVAIFSFSLAILLFTFIYRDEEFRETYRYTIQGMALFPIFWLAIRHPNWSIFCWLNWKPVMFCGAVSYVFYLVHLIALTFAARLTNIIVIQAVIGFFIALGFSWLMLITVERPFAEMRRRLHRD